MHGHLPRNLDENLVDIEQSYRWLKSGDIKGETESTKPVCEEGDVTVLWNQAVRTDREVTAHRPDIIIKNKKEKTCTLIDVAIPADRNVVQKEAEKKLKYKSLWIEIQ